ncbi:hypothetical protein BH11PAT4_BH11PAT4_0770 [soil metagenome]
MGKQRKDSGSVKPKWLNIYLIFVVLIPANALALLLSGPPAPEANSGDVRLFSVAIVIMWLASVCFWVGSALYGASFPTRKGIWPSIDTGKSLFFLTITIISVQKITATESPSLLQILGTVLFAGASIWFAYQDHLQLMQAKRK